MKRREARAARFPLLESYWHDRDERRRIDAETAHCRAISAANWDAKMAALNEKQSKAWEQSDA